MSKEAIKRIIPYGEGFLFLDGILMLNKDRITAIKELSPDESYFKSHFIGFPIMPGTLIVEGFGQAGTILARKAIDNHEGRDILLYSINKFRFHAPLFPKNIMKYDVVLKYIDEKFAIVAGSVFNENDKLIAEGVLTLAIVDRK